MRIIHVSPDFPLNRRMRKAVRRGKLEVVREGGENATLGGTSPLDTAERNSCWLLFLDESGHDHKKMPYEVRGGFALPVGRLWSFVQNLRREEEQLFGARLAEFKSEIKGSHLLDKDRFKFAGQSEQMDPETRRKLALAFLRKGMDKEAKPSKDEFTAYGQACLEMARKIFQILNRHNAKIFAAAIPRGVRPKPSDGGETGEYLRKDFVFLLERYFYFLDERKEHGLLVLDEVEHAEDRRFARRLERYFVKTETGRRWAAWVAPTPFFVSSVLSEPIQAADLVIYCVNWGFRTPARGMDADVRREIADNFNGWIRRLQYQGARTGDDPGFYPYGIVFVPDPYEARR